MTTFAFSFTFNLCLLIFMVLVVIILIYTLILRKQIHDSIKNWWDSLISTFVSVLLALVVGLWLFQYNETLTNRNKKNSYCKLLSSEFSDTNRILSTESRMTIKIKGNNYPVLITYVQPIIIEDAARSGLFNETITGNLLHLARMMKMFNIKTEFVLDSMASAKPPYEDKFEENMQNRIENINKSKEGIVSSIDFLAKQLKINLSSLIERK